MKFLIAYALVVLLLAGCGGSGSTADATASPAQSVAAFDQAMAITAQVREMATEYNVVTPGTPLEAAMIEHGHTLATCWDYATAMVNMVQALGNGVQTRVSGTCFQPHVPGGGDCHVVVELYDPTSGRWVIADPTFGLAPHNAADNSQATLDDMQTMARTKNWGAISYEFLTPQGAYWANNYYLDYPLLFVNVLSSCCADSPTVSPEDTTVLADYETLVPSDPATRAVYNATCPPGSSSVSLTIDDAPVTLPCDSVIGMTVSFWATHVTAQPGAAVYTPLRNVF